MGVEDNWNGTRLAQPDRERQGIEIVGDDQIVSFSPKSLPGGLMQTPVDTFVSSRQQPQATDNAFE